jgi:hypothetical protein
MEMFFFCDKHASLSHKGIKSFIALAAAKHLNPGIIGQNFLKKDFLEESTQTFSATQDVKLKIWRPTYKTFLQH